MQQVKPINVVSDKLGCKNLKVQYINARSIRNKTEIIFIEIIDKEIDIFVITESWLTNDESDIVSLQSIIPSGCKFMHLPKPNRTGRGGGVAVVHLDTFRKEEQHAVTYSTFEHMELLLTTGNSCI